MVWCPRCSSPYWNKPNEKRAKMSNRPERRKPSPKCYNCDKPAFAKYGNTPLCVDCYCKVADANFLEQQTMHNRQSWLASQLNYTEQQLYSETGGLLPPTQMTIPKPPSAGSSYTFSQIQVSDSNVGVINPGTLLALNTSIEVMQNRGDSELANAVKELSEAVIADKQITDDLKEEITEQLELLVAEALAGKDKRKGLARSVMNSISQSAATVSGLLTIWNHLLPLLQSHFG